MTSVLKTPFLGVNESTAVVVHWLVEAGTYVKTGQIVCVLETAKATVEVSADTTGYLFPIRGQGVTVVAGEELAYVSEKLEFSSDNLIDTHFNTVEDAKAITKKAEILIKRYKIDLDEIERFAAHGRISEEVVEKYRMEQFQRRRRIGMQSPFRVGIIGGVSGGGAAIVIDSIHRSHSQKAMYIYDRDESYHGEFILGVEIKGTMDLIFHHLEKKQIDVVVLAFNRNLEERDKVFRELRAKGVPFANVIDPSVDIRSQVSIGVGNVILAHAYIGACSIVGDNNFISANAAFEHGNYLGDSCAFGPGVFTSGNVTIKNKVRFGTGIFVEPGLTIGESAVIGSGNIVTVDVRDGLVLKSKSHG
jgi:acetyltransferase-like isoleucine patch superfamily enzyme